MKPAEVAIWGVGLAGAGVASYYVWKNYFAAQMELPPGVTGPQGEQGPAVVRVQNRERANGARQELQTFLDWWNISGPFPILVAPDGGVRTDAAKQLLYFQQGNSKAKTLDQTPHGHSSALDLWPVGFNPAVPLDQQPVIKARFAEMGRIAKEMFNFTWGGDWGWDFPHIEVKGWKTYPMPSGSRAVSGLSGLGEVSESSSSPALGPVVAVGLIGLVVYQTMIRRDEGPRTLRKDKVEVAG